MYQRRPHILRQAYLRPAQTTGIEAESVFCRFPPRSLKLDSVQPWGAASSAAAVELVGIAKGGEPEVVLEEECLGGGAL